MLAAAVALVASALGFGRLLGVRGVSFRFHAGGRFEITLADAFAGPIEAIEASEAVGTSGVAMGRWRVDGDHRLAFSGLHPHGMTLHGRAEEAFVMPLQGQGSVAWIPAMQDHPWTWAPDPEGDGRLRMTGRMMGAPLEVRLRRSS